MKGGVASVMLVFALGTSGMMLGMSGFTQAWGAEPPRTAAAQEEVKKSSEQLKPQNKPNTGPVSEADSSVVGLISSGLSSLTNIAGAVVLLPQTLINLNFPAWFAVPVGLIPHTLVGISLIEFATNREWT